MQSVITAKGQTTIPKEIREHLKLKPGDKVKFFPCPDGSVTILPVVPVTAMLGFLKRSFPNVSNEDMDEAIAAGAIGAPLPKKQP